MNTSGPLRVSEECGRLYVVGQGPIYAVNSPQEGEKLIELLLAILQLKPKTRLLLINRPNCARLSAMLSEFSKHFPK
jgi:hypothetical protein